MTPITTITDITITASGDSDVVGIVMGGGLVPSIDDVMGTVSGGLVVAIAPCDTVSVSAPVITSVFAAKHKRYLLKSIAT